METTIKLMIEQADTEENYSLIEYVRQLIDKFASTFNCPSDWRNIGEKLAEEYKNNEWVFKQLELWNYLEEERYIWF